MQRFFFICACLFALCCSCSTTQKIQVKQKQADQEQTVDIEHNGKIENFSLNFYGNKPFNFTKL